MNVVFVAYEDLRGAGVIHAYNFACEIARMGDRVLFLMPGLRESVGVMDRAPGFEIGILRFDHAILVPSLRARIAAFSPDIVHVWTPRNIPARAALEIRLRTGARIVIHYEDDEEFVYNQQFPPDPLFRARYTIKTLGFPRPGEPHPHLWFWKNPLISALANRAAASFTALSPALRDSLAARWSKRIDVLYPGVDLDKFHPGAAPAPVRERFGLSGRKLVVYSGSVALYHDFDILLRAIAIVVRKDPSVCLLQFGRFAWTEERTQALINELGIRDHVVLGGEVPHREIPAHLAAADVLVHPARFNDFNTYRLPSKIPEYLAMGKPAVISQAGIGAEFRDRVEVLKTRTEDPAELAGKITELLGDEALRDALGKGARLAAERLFNLEANALQLRGIYRSVCPGKKPAAPARGGPTR
ncbi:MAG TPA: glycosyltransferase [bacterium]|nr:glycosyltransferase family 4 protein [Chlamydiota bacterium]HOE26698.1 glycosyltransferase [bacterium]HQM52985.1 glycosyltransferase [bacterium]